MNKLLFSMILSIVFVASLSMFVSCGASSPNDDTLTTPPDLTSPGTDFTPESNVEVLIEDLAFSPATLTIGVGTTVIWTNRDFVNHTLTSRTGIFDSGIISRGATYSRTFTVVGDFEYFCTLHSEMVGFIIVK